MLHPKLIEGCPEATRLRYRNAPLTPERRKVRAWRRKRNTVASSLLYKGIRKTAIEAVAEADRMMRGGKVMFAARA